MAGRAQLAVTGIQDQWLTGEPKFSYFVSVYKRHTRFSTEAVEMPFTGETSFGRSVECHIPTNIGDLIRGVTLKVKLGNLSPHALISTPYKRYYYNIPLGKSIIKYADLVIGGQIIERLTGDYIYMYDQLHGNRDDVKQTLYYLNGHNETLTVSDSYNTFYVNLPFYFHRNPSLAVPICALTKQLVEVRITFRDIDDDVSFKYTIPSNGQVTREKTTEGSIKSASIITDFYFITEDEKNFLLTRPMEYVITQLQKSTIQFKQGELKKSALLKFTNPVKELLFLAKEETGNNYSETIALPETLNLLGTAIVPGSSWDGILPSDQFGRSVSMSADGTRVAIGAPYVDGVNGTGSGRVQVYELIGSSWTQVGNDIDGEAAGDRFGHSVSMSADGTRVAIGAPYASGGSDGHVQVYDLIGSSWTQVGATIVGTGSGAELLSGFSVSLSADGSRVAIGAPEAEAFVTDLLPMNGQVIVYDLIGTSWTQVGDIIYGNNTFYWGAKSGWSISLSSNGSRIAIGSLISHGRVQVFDLIGSVWTQVGNDINGEVPVSSDIITSVSVSLSSDGSRVAIGQPKNNRGGGILASGHVRVFDLIGSSWTQVGVDIDGEIADEQMGHSVSLSSDGSRVAVGAPHVSIGRVQVFDLIGSVWTQVGVDVYSGGNSGYSVSMSSDGSRFAVGAPTPYLQTPSFIAEDVRVYESSSINETTHTDRLLNTSSSDQSFSSVLKGFTIGSSTNTKRSDHRTIKNIDFQCNGATVFDHSGQYLAYQQALRYHTGCPDPAYEFYTYSFALKPEVYYPTGQLNMSRIIHKKLDIELDTVPTATSGATVADKTRNINVGVYAVNYNILRIEGGLAGLKF